MSQFSSAADALREVTDCGGPEVFECEATESWLLLRGTLTYEGAEFEREIEGMVGCVNSFVLVRSPSTSKSSKHQREIRWHEEKCRRDAPLDDGIAEPSRTFGQRNAVHPRVFHDPHTAFRFIERPKGQPVSATHPSAGATSPTPSHLNSSASQLHHPPIANTHTKYTKAEASLKQYARHG